MNRSDLGDVATRVRDGVCVLGCSLRGAHFASCPDYGKEPAESTCRGCAPSPTTAASVICSRCFGRIRGLLRDAPDLVGRLRSLSDPTKAMLIEPVKVFTRAVEAIAPVGPDLLDAADEILSNLRDWAHSVAAVDVPWHARFSGMGSVAAYRLAAEYSDAIITHLATITLDPVRTIRLAEAVTVPHPEVEGERDSWSIADAMDRWGAERRDRHVHPDVDAEPDREDSSQPVREWYDPILTIKDAAARHKVTSRAVQRWISSGDLVVAARMRGPKGTVMMWVKASEVDEVAARMEEKRSPGRPRNIETLDRLDTPEGATMP